MAYIRLTDPAIDDLRAIYKLDPSVLRLVLKKMLLLETNPRAGEPLMRELAMWRKLTVGDRHWRIVWIPKQDMVGQEVIEIAQVWAIGARNDEEIYEETKQRIESLPVTPRTTSLIDVLTLLNSRTIDIVAAAEPLDEPAPAWLITKLEKNMGLSKDQVRGLSREQAVELWEEHISRPK